MISKIENEPASATCHLYFVVNPGLRGYSYKHCVNLHCVPKKIKIIIIESVFMHCRYTVFQTLSFKLATLNCTDSPAQGLASGFDSLRTLMNRKPRRFWKIGDKCPTKETHLSVFAILCCKNHFLL